jgi:hypothetical protein
MLTTSKKAKGRRLQQWVCEQIANVLGATFSSDDDAQIKSRNMGQSGCDVIIDVDLLDRFPYSIECKNQEKWSIVKDIEQAKKNTKKDTSWLLFYKRNHHDPVVVMDASTFFDLIRKTQ